MTKPKTNGLDCTICGHQLDFCECKPKTDERKYMNIEWLIDKHYDNLFHDLCELDVDIYELKIEYKEFSTGKTITRSWKDREDRLSENNK